MSSATSTVLFFFFNDTATTEIYTLSLHDALPILAKSESCSVAELIADESRRKRIVPERFVSDRVGLPTQSDRKSTRLNSSHQIISYAVFCLKKKKTSGDRTIHDFWSASCSLGLAI